MTPPLANGIGRAGLQHAALGEGERARAAEQVEERVADVCCSGAKAAFSAASESDRASELKVSETPLPLKTMLSKAVCQCLASSAALRPASVRPRERSANVVGGRVGSGMRAVLVGCSSGSGRSRSRAIAALDRALSRMASRRSTSSDERGSSGVGQLVSDRDGRETASGIRAHQRGEGGARERRVAGPRP